MKFGTMPVAAAEGAILAHAVMATRPVFRKGRRLSAEDLRTLAESGVTNVVAAVLEPGDVPEDAAAARLAAAVAGEHARIADAFTGRVNLFAEAPGLLVVDRARIDRLNERDEAVTLATLPEYAQVTPGQMIATIKIIPFAVPEDVLGACLELAAGAPLVRVAPYRPLRARLVQTLLPGTSAKMLDKTVAVTRQRLEALGGSLVGETRCAHDTAALAAELQPLAADADLVLIAGASAITDRRDVLPAGIEAAGGTVEHFGMPVDPGNLILLARLGGVPVLGLPGCARSPKLNGFDWVLQRLAAGLEVTRRDVMRMGVGGLLMEIPTRPQPREGKTSAPAPAKRPRIAAIVLAAGQSRRMGPRNKLLIEIDGKPMVRRAVEAALAARVQDVIVVTGHQRAEVAALLGGMPVRFVHNPDYEHGLSTSLKAGLDALPPDTDAALVCLGDMPRVTGRLIAKLVAAYNPVEGRAIVVPTHHGKRGNPVLWDRSLFREMREVAGDVGARHLIGLHDDLVLEVEAGDDATLVDVDTPEALAALAKEPA
ncbi:MAG TPA: molybdopterin-binding/glycosyltransferase family 2 protein [Geminicoccaceae bacterium]|nr:molybdopterin-binding/glycosyltransferase family 2 protein [Geminicoccaceae bacterium]